MLPLFGPGGIVLVEGNSRRPELSSAISPGDCAVYNFGGRRLLHRVIKKEAGGLWFSDDAGLLSPHFVQWENIKGKAFSRNPLKNGFIGLAYSRLRRFLS